MTASDRDQRVEALFDEPVDLGPDETSLRLAIASDADPEQHDAVDGLLRTDRGLPRRLLSPSPGARRSAGASARS